MIEGPNYTITNVTVPTTDTDEFEAWCSDLGIECIRFAPAKGGFGYILREVGEDTLAHIKLRWAPLR